jgi:hypothetical protein
MWSLLYYLGNYKKNSPKKHYKFKNIFKFLNSTILRILINDINMAKHDNFNLFFILSNPKYKKKIVF